MERLTREHLEALQAELQQNMLILGSKLEIVAYLLGSDEDEGAVAPATAVPSDVTEEVTQNGSEA